MCLCTVEYTGLHDAIKEWNFQELEQLNEHRRFLERIEPSITKHLKPSELIAHMSGCLKPRECEEIQAVSLLLNMMCVCVCFTPLTCVRAVCVCYRRRVSAAV